VDGGDNWFSIFLLQFDADVAKRPGEVCMDEVKVEVVLFNAPLHHLQSVINQDLAQPEERDIGTPRIIDLYVVVGIVFTEFVFFEIAIRSKNRGDNENFFEMSL